MFKIAPEGHPFVGTLALLSLGMAMTARVCGGAWDGAVALATLVLVVMGKMLYGLLAQPSVLLAYMGGH